MEINNEIVRSFLDYLTYERNYSAHTRTAYEKDVENFITFIQTRYKFSPLESTDEFLKIKPEITRAWFAALTGEVATKKRAVAGVRAFFKYLRKLDLIEKNPLGGIKFEKRKRRLPQFLSQDEAMQLFSTVFSEEDFVSVRDRCALELLYGCGLRRSEVAALRFQDVDLDAQTLRVLGKGNKIRAVPFTSAVQKALKSYFSACERENFDIKSGLLLKNKKGLDIQSGTIYLLTRRALATYTRLKRKSPHVLRHSYATHLVENGAELNVVKDLLGHSSIISTQIYLHNSIDRLRDVYLHAHPGVRRPPEKNNNNKNEPPEQAPA